MFPGFTYRELSRLDVRGVRVWLAEAENQRSENQLSAIQAASFPNIEEAERKAIQKALQAGLHGSKEKAREQDKARHTVEADAEAATARKELRRELKRQGQGAQRHGV